MPAVELHGPGQMCAWDHGNLEHNLRELYKHADPAKEILDREFDAIAAEAGLDPATAVVKVRLKGKERVVEKSAGKYAKKHPESNGLALVMDIVRMSIMCETEDQVLIVLEVIRQKKNLIIKRFKNLFSDLDAPHFRRLMCNVGVELDPGFFYVCEVQVHIKAIFNFKLTNDHLCHAPYEFFRSLLKAELNEVMDSKEHW